MANRILMTKEYKNHIKNEKQRKKSRRKMINLSKKKNRK